MITKADIDKYINEDDYYALLGVEKESKTQEIEKAFRKLSVKWHPDKQKFKDDSLKEDATKIFKKLSEAKEILCDENKRQIYDKYGLEGLKERGPDMHPEHHQEMMNEFMKQMFGQNMSKASGVPDIKLQEEVSLEDLFTGKDYKKEIERYSLCKECNGYGTEDGLNHKCTDCGGSGVQIKVTRMGNVIQQQQQICTLCHGGGTDPKVDKCKKCNGKKLVKEKKEINIKIPKGAFGGITIGIRGEGNEIPPEDRNGSTTRTNIAINIKEKKHSLFERGFKIPKYKENSNPKDLKLNLQISLVESLTGFSKKIKFLDGKDINILHEKIIKNGDVMVIPNYGMPVLNENKNGNLYVVFDVEYPDDLNTTTKRRLWQLLTNTPYKEITNMPNKVTLESAEKYRFEDFTNRHENGFPFMGGMPPGFNAHFAGMGNMGNMGNNMGNDDSDNSDDENSGGGQPNCKVQ
jgi:DnaJ-class molecular chaperone